jgi:hypothetical protein
MRGTYTIHLIFLDFLTVKMFEKEEGMLTNMNILTT